MNPFFSILLLATLTGCHVHTHSGAYEYYVPRRADVYYEAPSSYVTCVNLSHQQCADRHRYRPHAHRRYNHSNPYPRSHKERGWFAHATWSAHAGSH